MTQITFNLIRAKNPEITDANNIEEVDSIKLNDCNIEEIDNLELFSHISELYLCNNQITFLDNLFFLKNLKILDLSNNKIDGESLKKSIENLPKSLISIYLAGNPCVEDEASLVALQDSFPDMIIAIDVDLGEQQTMEESKKSDEIADSDEKQKDVDEENENLPPSEYNGPLDSEQVLKSIVERKCKMQSYTAFNLDLVVKVKFIFPQFFLSVLYYCLIYTGS
jgi:hypothetical protein